MSSDISCLGTLSDLGRGASERETRRVRAALRGKFHSSFRRYRERALPPDQPKMPFIVTAVLLASVAYLLYEAYKRIFLDFGDSEAVATMLALPFVNRPDLKRVDQVSLNVFVFDSKDETSLFNY